MSATTPPIDIGTPPRFGSNSPRNRSSNLTSALQEAGATGNPLSANNVVNRSEERLSASTRLDSISSVALGSSYHGSGARPIMTKERPRRESNTAGSFMGGMSWGGISVGSWVRDDVMSGTSPNDFKQSPSYHSSSYLPKMEANYIRDFTCCGLPLESLHELLSHWDEHHQNQNPQVSNLNGLSLSRRDSNPLGQSSTSRSFQPFDNSQASSSRTPTFQQPRNREAMEFSKSTLATVQDMDALEDMELDDSGLQNYDINQEIPLPNLNTGMPAQQAFRTSTPTTPSAHTAFSLFSNPTVSSVNTPALNTQSFHRSQNKSTPESSIPTTPAATGGPSYDNAFGLDMFGMPNPAPMPGSFDFNNLDFGLPTLDGLTIHEPAKRLSSKNGNSNLTQQQIQAAISTGQIPMDSVNKAMLDQQFAGAMGGSVLGFPHDEIKKYRCPVIGCEKAYKNQNGLKYHKVHGHTKQTLKRNDDDTYSIVDPITNVAYPGTIGMEKEKPYRCEVCGKRYKNLNGLKYHRQHSIPCNPELRNTVPAVVPGLESLPGLSQQKPLTGNIMLGASDSPALFPMV